ncbi:piriformospora indica-insensitive protein 2-like [Dorcoceras hygrometricum]|uniref:Piriformospora indica-insensitive protein 2-like n=1 Tax=Dorcoceras hygrometricum TaxID=472368 RepID=A0A2Z7CVA8_9LAMI|nr:piriformospora indica-insensitive protein 2-like [Dorcoceras hygrometricum]
MALMSLLLVGFLVLLSPDNNEVMCAESEDGGSMLVMEKEELYGLFEVMGSLLEDPTWGEMHPQPCTETPWPGVECELLQETSTFHITKIHVGPEDTTPPCKDSAKISESLLKLPYLKTLSLINCFTKSPVSLSEPLFGALPSLEHLALESNPSLSGEIPSTLSNLTGLKILCLSQNNMSGEIPKEIASLVNLEQLDFSHNSLTGSIPEEIGMLKSLSILDFSWNSLQGVVPSSVGEMQFLEKIDLGSNKLQGRLPQELGKLKSLVFLDLSLNSLTGPMPEKLIGLQQLQYLIMEGNPINTSIPSFIGALNKLIMISFSGCGLTGSIPTIFSNLTNLTALYLDDNSLTGTVPQQVGTLPNLDLLNLSRNRLTGELLLPQDFIARLGNKLDIRENNGLCTNRNPSCSSSLFPADNNKTWAGRNPDMKPTLYQGPDTSSYSPGLNKKFVFFPSIHIFLLFALLN